MAEDIELNDFEECLLDFMDYNFNIMLEDNSAKEVGTPTHPPLIWHHNFYDMYW